MAILRRFKDQLVSDRRMRNGELSIIEAEGVMMDGNDEIDSYYAGLVSMPKSQLNSSENRAGSPSTIWPNSSETTADSFALRFGLEEDKFIDANTGLPLDEGL